MDFERNRLYDCTNLDDSLSGNIASVKAVNRGDALVKLFDILSYDYVDYFLRCGYYAGLGSLCRTV